MELLLTSKSIEMFPGVHQTVWFIDLKEGNSLTDICNGTKEYCLAQKEELAMKLHLDGGKTHQKLKALGMR